MFRFIAWVLLALYLLVVGLWPPAAAPLALMLAGLAVVAALIPGPAWALAAAIAWHRSRSNRTAVTA